MENGDALGGVLALFSAGAVFVGFAVGIALYVLFALALKTMADNKGIEKSWLAWIPIAQFYLLGLIVGEVVLFDKKITNLEWILLAIPFVNIVPVIGQILFFIGALFMIFINYTVFKRYKPGKEVMYTIISVILPFTGPIFYFLVRNNTPVE